MLIYDPATRISSRKALKHPYFNDSYWFYFVEYYV
uniref:Protein kinase domain-containing protein n=1 Tax=Heterorhabditis bacteriophora TaxID=37862 RepID=A0A1I7X7D1_HETBA